MVIWYRIGRCLLRALFTDTVTVITRVPAENWLWDTFAFEISEIGGYQLVSIGGVQWSAKEEKVNNNGRVSIRKYAAVTFPKGVYENINFDLLDEEFSIFYGHMTEVPVDEKGKRLSDLLGKYPKSGLVKSVNDNSNRTMLPHVKVVLE